MEKVCEFCVTFRSVIYCKADAAYLCLSCDSKVHLANPLSNRHPRNLVCKSCKCHPAYVRCYDHEMFMCRGCDHSQHEFSLSPQHLKRVINNYMGCPSAQDLATLWGFNLNGFAASNFQDKFGPSSSLSVNTGGVNSGSRVSVFGTNPKLGSSTNQDTKAFYGGMQKENTFSILQQLLDLKKLQLTDESETSSLIRHQDQTCITSSNSDTTWKLDNRHDQHFPQSTLLDLENPHHDLNLEQYSLPFLQLDQLTSSSMDGSTLQGDSFWQCKSPVQSGQLWPQNMQDLGVCEELACLDDFNIPDVDLTFRNFEELFRGEQDPAGTTLLEDKGMACSSIENDTLLDTSDNSYATAIEDTTSVDTSVSIANQSTDPRMGPPKKACCSSRSEDCPRPIRQSYSALSFSLSRLSAESNSTDCMDTGLSPTISCQEVSFNSPDRESAAKGNIMTRHKEKKNDQRNDQQQIQCGYRKARSNLGNRVKSQIWKTEGFKSETVDVTRSY